MAYKYNCYRSFIILISQKKMFWIKILKKTRVKKKLNLDFFLNDKAALVAVLRIKIDEVLC